MIVSSASLRRADDRRLLALLGVEVAAQQQAAHADDGVHRGADLVAHGRQERALGGVGGVGRARAPPARSRTAARCPARSCASCAKRCSRSTSDSVERAQVRGIARDSERADGRRRPTASGTLTIARIRPRGKRGHALRPAVVVVDHRRLERLHHLARRGPRPGDRQVRVLLEHAHRGARLERSAGARAACRRSRGRCRAAPRARASTSLQQVVDVEPVHHARARSRAAPPARRSARPAPRVRSATRCSRPSRVSRS